MADAISRAPTPQAAADGMPETGVVGRRVLATIVDAVLLVIVVGAVSALGVLLAALFTSGSSSSSAGGSVAAFIVVLTLSSLLSLVLFFAYYVGLEAYRGQTVGKMIFGIEVVKEDTRGAPGLKAALIRTLLRLVDGIFSGYLVGFIVVVSSAKHQSLGDMAAHTLVVRKNASRGEEVANSALLLGQEAQKSPLQQQASPEGAFTTQEASTSATPSASAVGQQHYPGVVPQQQIPQRAGGSGAAATASGSRKGLVIGGAIAALLGTFVVLALIGGGLFLLFYGAASSSDTSSAGTPATASGSSASGSLRDLVQQQVGDFKLQKVDDYPDLVSAGATEGLQASYAATSDGTQVEHLLGSFPSSEQADRYRKEVVDQLVSQGYTIADQHDITDKEGRVAGTAVRLEQGNNNNAVVWSNKQLFATAAGGTAAGSSSTDFYNSSEH